MRWCINFYINNNQMDAHALVGLLFKWGTLTFSNKGELLINESQKCKITNPGVIIPQTSKGVTLSDSFYLHASLI